MLQSVRQSVSPSVSLSRFLILSRSLDGGMCIALVAASNVFDRGQDGRLCPRRSAMSGGHIVSPRDTSLY